MYPKPCLLIMACLFMYNDLYLCFAVIYERSTASITSSGASPTEHQTQYCTVWNCVLIHNGNLPSSPRTAWLLNLALQVLIYRISIRSFQGSRGTLSSTPHSCTSKLEQLKYQTNLHLMSISRPPKGVLCSVWPSLLGCPHINWKSRIWRISPQGI